VGSGGRPRLPASKFLFLLSKRIKINACLVSSSSLHER
jgi:hypothetical protein